MEQLEIDLEGKEIEAEYAEMVDKLVKPGEFILKALTPERCNLWHMATGVSGEAGELSDAVKRWTIYNKPLDLANVVEEMGDLEFYLQGIRSALGISRAEVLQANKEKLAVRYAANTYSDEAAQERADKVTEVTEMGEEDIPDEYR